jgi:hypothetical protein
MSVSTLRANSLTDGEIGSVLGRMGLLAPGDRLVCVPRPPACHSMPISSASGLQTPAN